MVMRSNNLALLHRDRGYRFGEGGSSLLHQVRIAVNNSGLTSVAISGIVLDWSGETVDRRTIDKIMSGATQLPRLRTVELIMGALGYRLSYTK
jgi:hypothetical protein